jgi:hypothetical protein
MTPSRIHWCFLALASAIAGCGGGGTRVSEGPTPYVRCMALEPPSPRKVEVGPARLTLEGRELTIAGLPSPLRIAALSEPGLGGAPSAAAVAALKAAAPHLVVVLGGLGETQQAAGATAVALAEIGVPVLVVAGGRDRPERLSRALASVEQGRERIIDATALRAIHIGDDTLVPVAGASEGRYASGPEACGHALDDLKQVASELGGKTERRRWLLSWHAPGGAGAEGVARTETGLDLGSVDVAELGRRLGAPGGLFAWPTVQVGRATVSNGARRVGRDVPAPDLRLVVPGMGGVAIERDDTSRLPPGFALLQLDEQGLRLVRILQKPV